MNVRLAITILAASLAPGLAACGGGSHSTTAPSSSATPASSSSASESSQAPAASASSTTASVPPEVPRSKRRRLQHATHPLPAASGVEVPASFTIGSGAKLSPATISVPKSTPILVRIKDTDSDDHTVVITGSVTHTLHAAPGATVTKLIAGSANGSHRVLVDGRPAGLIIVGSTPGP